MYLFSLQRASSVHPHEYTLGQALSTSPYIYHFILLVMADITVSSHPWRKLPLRSFSLSVALLLTQLPLPILWTLGFHVLAPSQLTSTSQHWHSVKISTLISNWPHVITQKLKLPPPYYAPLRLFLQRITSHSQPEMYLIFLVKCLLKPTPYLNTYKTKAGQQQGCWHTDTVQLLMLCPPFIWSPFTASDLMLDHKLLRIHTARRKMGTQPMALPCALLPGIKC